MHFQNTPPRTFEPIEPLTASAADRHRQKNRGLPAGEAVSIGFFVHIYSVLYLTCTSLPAVFPLIRWLYMASQ